jgi:hypothetical protein
MLTALVHGIGAARKQESGRGHPAHLMRALQLYLDGKPDQAAQWAPQLASSGAACVRRSADILAFYQAIASSSGMPSVRQIAALSARSHSPMRSKMLQDDSPC